MTVERAGLFLLVLIAMVEAFAIYGLARRIRLSEVDAVGEHMPGVGFRPSLVDELADGHEWPTDILTSDCVIAIVTAGCQACSTLVDTLKVKPPQVPVYVLASRDDMMAGLAETTVDLRFPVIATRKKAHELEGWGNPGSFPTILRLNNGEVVKSTYRLVDAS